MHLLLTPLNYKKKLNYQQNNVKKTKKTSRNAPTRPNDHLFFSRSSVVFQWMTEEQLKND
jgi:hypothetical protein